VPDQPRRDEGIQRREKRQVRDQQAARADGQRPVQSAERLDDGRGPVDSAGEVAEAGNQPEQKRAPRPKRRRLGEREEQRRERDPRDSRMAVAREAACQEGAGEDG
jgi:hypothetical protein